MMSIQSSPTAVTHTDDAQTEAETATAELSLDTVFEMLSNERRRQTCRYLLDNPGGTTLGTLAEQIASLENDKPVPEITSQERKRVYVGLYQCHLPKMDDVGVVDFDADRKSIEVGGNIDQVTAFLPENEDSRRVREDGWTDAVADFRQAVGDWL